MACFLLHNFIQNEMVIDPMDARLDAQPPSTDVPENPIEFISTVEATPTLTAHRKVLAHAMWAEYWNGYS